MTSGFKSTWLVVNGQQVLAAVIIFLYLIDLGNNMEEVGMNIYSQYFLMAYSFYLESQVQISNSPVHLGGPLYFI